MIFGRGLSTPLSALDIGVSYRDISSQLLLRGISVLPQVEYKSHERAKGQSSLGDNGNQHPKRHDRHGLLGREIAIFTLVTLIGGWLCYRALNYAGDARNVFQAVAGGFVCLVSAWTAAFGLVALLLGSV